MLCGRGKLAIGQRFAVESYNLSKPAMKPLKYIPTISLLMMSAVVCANTDAQGPQRPLPSSQTSQKEAASATPSEAAEKLMLKDGTFQLVREYQRKGERVRYLSAERGDWEEIPAAMVDWDATAKAEASVAKEQEALLKKWCKLIVQSAVAREVGKQHRLQRALRPRDGGSRR